MRKILLTLLSFISIGMIVAQCSIDSIYMGSQTACDPQTNTFDQDVVVEYTNAPASGTLNVALVPGYQREAVPITTSPQTITLADIDAQIPVQGVIVYFSDASSSVDDFQDGTTQGWVSGNNNPNPPVHESDGGPNGTGDDYLLVTSNGGAGAGSKLVVFNQTQWGNGLDITSAGYLGAIVDINNTGNTDLNIRLAIDGAGGRFCTDEALSVPAGSGWISIAFGFSPSDFTSVGGSDIGLTFSDVSEIRLLHNPVADWEGVSVQGALGVDNFVMASCGGGAIPAFTSPCVCVPLNVGEGITSDTCGQNTGAIQLEVTGGISPYTYSWSNGETTEDISGLASGTYSVTITSFNGCDTVLTYNVGAVGFDPVLSTSSTDVTNCLVPDGTATVQVTAGNPGATFDYEWNDAQMQTTATAIALTAGQYLATVTDSWGCSMQAMAIVNNVSGFSMMLDSTNHVSCFGLNDGEIYLSVVGGIGPFEYDWNDLANPLTDEDRSGMLAGTYSVTVTDDNDCSYVLAGLQVTEPDEITTTFTTTAQTDGDNPDGSATVTVSGGLQPYDYLWDDPSAQITAEATQLAAGTYTVSITDANDCAASGSVQVADSVITSIRNINVQQFSVYPNPVKEQLHVSFEVDKTQHFTIQLINTIGKVVYELELKNVLGKIEKDIPVQSLSNGIYFVQMGNEEGAAIQKIVVNK